MPLVEKEIIGPATHWYRDEATGQPRKLVVTPDMTRYWAEQGNKMLGLGLTVPVPCEHDFDAHPMTPADKLKNNAGWVKEYKTRDTEENGVKRKDVLFGVVDIQDPDIAKKLPTTIRWTSPWISSFTDGQGRDWKNVISHLALTTRPRVVNQAPFSGIAAALSIAQPVATIDQAVVKGKGLTLSKAGRLVWVKKGKKHRAQPEFPRAFSLYAGVKLAEDDMFSDPEDDDDDDFMSGDDGESDGADDIDTSGADNILTDQVGDIAPPEAAAAPGGEDTIPITELLSQLLPILGVQMPDARFLTSETFMRELCTAMLAKVTQLAQGAQQQQPPPNQPPPQAAPRPQAPGQPNPLIQQEQQPMYMSLEDIQKVTDPTMKTIALSMYKENVKLRGELDAGAKLAGSLRDAKLKEENAKRTQRVTMLGKLSPRVKADLDAMLALPAMALSMGDGGAVNDPMAQTLAVLEKGLADMPRLLTTPQADIIALAQPTDADMLSAEQVDKLADDLARQMGCPPEQKKAG